jgi:hypothetical protein
MAALPLQGTAETTIFDTEYYMIKAVIFDLDKTPEH